ncbi:MAG: carboxylating nicotinate-nucleotide diphosphorylase [Bacteroidetes bacterium]|nr:carboxylating nicotinate-nucleotide diphosphorylase [Bacteroidota bacterium]
MNKNYLDKFIRNAFSEDIGEGDHTSFACIPNDTKGKAQLLIKQNGIIAGIEVAKQVFSKFDENLIVKTFINDGEKVNIGDIAFTVEGKKVSILQTERIVLNIMQRMSGIATQTNKYVEKIKDLKTKVLDTRKTTPGLRMLEKAAVKIGGGVNHRMGLYDMIMIKDNHVDYSGGIENAINNTKTYLKKNNLDLKIEVEVRSIDEVNKTLKIGGIHRIMLDNFTPEQTKKAVKIINNKFETESSGGINIDTIRSYAECGVDYVSVGALTHNFQSLDMSLKAIDYVKL